MPCHVALYRCLARSHHVTSYLAMSCLRLEFVTRLRTATQNQQMPLARETSTTEHSTLVVAPCHINQTLSRGASVPDISVCCSFFDRSKRATSNTVKNTTMSTLHIRLILLPSPEAHARVLAQLMTTCHSHRLQRFCERHGAQRPLLCCQRYSVLRGSCLPWNSGKPPLPARANDCMPSRRSRAEPRQFLHIRMSEKRHAVPDPVVPSHVKSCLTGHCAAT